MFWILLTGVCALAMAGAELLSRRMLRRRGRYYVFPPGLRLRLHSDPDTFPELERDVRFDINRDGERGSEVPRTARGDRLFRVLVAGGSQPEGYLLDQPTCWPGALQRLLDTPEPTRTLGAARVHVGSIARSGIGSEALHLVLQRVLPRYSRLDVIAILVGASDVLQWLEQGAPHSSPVPPRVHDIFMCHPEGPFGWTPGSSALIEGLRRSRRRWLKPVVLQERAARWIAKARRMRADAAEICTTTTDPSPMLDQFERCLRRLVELALRHADRVLVIEQPWFDGPFTPEEEAHMWHGGAGQAWRGDVSTYYSFEVVSGLIAAVNRRAARVACASGAEFLELMPILDGRLAMYYDGFHATPAGAQRIADVVGATILKPAVPAALDLPAAS